MQSQVINPDVPETIYAGFFIRLGAFLLDMLLVHGLLLPLRGIVWFFGYTFDWAFLTKDILFHYNGVDIFCYLCTVAYFTIMTCCVGATLGKMAAGLRVVSVLEHDKDNKRPVINILYRETIGRYLSSLLGIGYLLAVGDPQCAALHDRLSKTRVVKS